LAYERRLQEGRYAFRQIRGVVIELDEMGAMLRTPRLGHCSYVALEVTEWAVFARCRVRNSCMISRPCPVVTACEIATSDSRFVQTLAALKLATLSTTSSFELDRARAL
jgi:hypothetical protein